MSREAGEPAIFERSDEGKLIVSAEAKKHWSDKNSRKFTPDVAIKVIQFIGAGCFTETAAAAAGINKQTLYEWMRKAERDEDESVTPELRAWKVALDEAEATAEARAVTGIQQAGSSGVWQAYAWFLERKFPYRWGRKDTTMLANPDGSPLSPQKVTVTSVDPRDYDTVGSGGSRP